MTVKELRLELAAIDSAFSNAYRQGTLSKILPATRQRREEIISELRQRKGEFSFRINCHRLSNGTWEIDCPEWKYSRPVKNLTKELALLSAEIESTLSE